MSGENPIVVCAQCGAKNRIPAERWGESAKCGRCRAPLSSADRFPGSIISIADRAFEPEVLRFPGPVLLEFWAPWCGHCRTLNPVLDQLASEYTGRVKFGKMNIDEDSLTAAQFGVKGVPAMLFFKGGKLVSRLVGSQPKGEIERQLQAIL